MAKKGGSHASGSLMPVYVLLALILVMVGLPLLAPGVNPLQSEPELLYVQDAEGGSLTDNGDGTYTLSLTGVDEDTIWFFDRPERSAGDVSTQDFVTRWTEGQDSFTDDPPNAALRVHGADESEDTIIVELMNPVYNAAAGTLTYTVEMIPSGVTGFSSDGSVPETFEDASLFIDDSGEVCVPQPICISWDV